MTYTAPHRPAPDTGRNVHCTCGAEYSLRANLARHITRENDRAQAAQLAYEAARTQLGYVHQLDDTAMVQVSARTLKALLPR